MAEITGAAVVTFRVPVGQTGPGRAPEVGRGGRVTAEVTGEVTGEVTAEVTAEVARLLGALRRGALTRQALQGALRLKHSEHFRRAHLLPAIKQGLVEMAMPDKPTSSLQTYRLTPKGRALLASASTRRKE